MNKKLDQEFNNVFAQDWIKRKSGFRLVELKKTLSDKKLEDSINLDLIIIVRLKTNQKKLVGGGGGDGLWNYNFVVSQSPNL